MTRYIRKRVKCITTKRKMLPKHLDDPELEVGKFYNVVDESVEVMGDDPWIRVWTGTRTIDRPRSMFGPIMREERVI